MTISKHLVVTFVSDGMMPGLLNGNLAKIIASEKKTKIAVFLGEVCSSHLRESFIE